MSGAARGGERAGSRAPTRLDKDKDERPSQLSSSHAHTPGRDAMRPNMKPAPSGGIALRRMSLLAHFSRGAASGLRRSGLRRSFAASAAAEKHVVMVVESPSKARSTHHTLKHSLLIPSPAAPPHASAEPLQAKTIQKYLGDGYVVVPSVGHVRCLLPFLKPPLSRRHCHQPALFSSLTPTTRRSLHALAATSRAALAPCAPMRTFPSPGRRAEG